MPKPWATATAGCRHEITAGFVEAAQEFIGAAQRSGKPFYVNLWPDDVHSPFWPSPESWQPNRRARYRAVLEEMDQQIAPLFDLIRRDETLARNTLILICSDNGPARGAGDATPFRGYKTQLYEGGIRSPLIVWGPGLVSRRNAVNRRSVFSTLDLVPTLLDISGAGPPEAELDGAVVTEILLGSSDASRDAPLFFRRPPDRDAYYGRWNLPDLAMRKGRWKLLCEYDGSEPELYDLENDPGETTNLAEQHPQVVSNLTRALLAWHRSLPEDTDPGVLWKILALVLGTLEERFF